MSKRNRRSTRNRSRRKRYGARKQRPQRPPEDPTPPVSHRLDSIRERLWGIAAVVSCVEYASNSLLAPTNGKPDFENTMELLFADLSEVTGDLEGIIEELGGPPDVEDER